MSKPTRNYLLDSALLLLLGVNITSLVSKHNHLGAQVPPVHIASGDLLVVLCLAHILLHRSWIQAVLAGKVKARIKLSMDALVTVLLLLAGISGPLATSSTAASSFHSLTGSLTLLGLLIHGVKHTRWMACMTRKLVAGQKTTPLAHNDPAVVAFRVYKSEEKQFLNTTN